MVITFNLKNKLLENLEDSEAVESVYAFTRTHHI